MSTRPAAGPRDCLTDDPPPRRGGAPRPGLARVLAALYDTTAEQAAGGLDRLGVGPMIDNLPRRWASPAEAWEALATRDVIPAAWADDRDRVFFAPRPDQRFRGLPDAAGTFRAAPHDWPLLVALASDVEGVLTAEALARELARGLAAWDVDPSPRRGVVWQPERVASSAVGEAARRMVAALADELGPWSPALALYPGPSELQTAWRIRVWRRAREVVPRATWFQRVGVRVEALPDVFTLDAQIQCLGYVYGDLDPRRGRPVLGVLEP